MGNLILHYLNSIAFFLFASFHVKLFFYGPLKKFAIFWPKLLIIHTTVNRFYYPYYGQPEFLYTIFYTEGGLSWLASTNVL